MKHQLLTAALAAGFVLVSLAAGPYRRGALVGATIAGATALGSILTLGRFGRGAKPVQAALVVLTVFFFVRIVLVALGVFLVVRGGQSVPAFVIAFFLPYFVFAAVEGFYVHSLNRGTGPTA